MAKRYLRTADAARELGIGRNSLSRWAKAGKVTPAYVTPGGQNHWDMDDLHRQLRPITEGKPMIESPTAPEPQPVVASIVTSDLGVLVTRRHDGKPLWGFLTGEIEPGESPADAAIRECKEEAALAVEASHIIGRRVHPKTNRAMVYMAAAPRYGTKVFVGDPDELAEVRWVGLAEAEELMQPYGMFEPVRDYLERTLRSSS